MLQQKTTHLAKEDVEKPWFEVDASGKIVGRLATELANILRGKNLPSFSNHHDSGAFVVVTNCEKVVFTGKKWQDKTYFWHSNHVGGLKRRNAEDMLENRPDQILYLAVQRMLPKSSLGRKQLTKLKIFVGPEHSHSAQNPTKLDIPSKGN